MEKNINKSGCAISVITPSYNMLPYLQRAAASVADQLSANVEHIVMDGASSDGTAQWLAQKPFPALVGFSEADQGMYDAINKGLKIASGDILAYLNCDEQYLPGTLEYVARYFMDHPEVDILFGDVLLTQPDGSLMAYRKGYQPRWYYILTSHLYVLSCTMFFRRRVLAAGFFFDTRFRAVGDADFVVRVLRHGFRAHYCRRYFSAFTMTGKNLSSDPRAITEQKELLRSAPFFLRGLKPLVNLARFTEKFLSGAYHQRGPIHYAVYPAPQEPGENTTLLERKHVTVTHASFRWQFLPPQIHSIQEK